MKLFASLCALSLALAQEDPFDPRGKNKKKKQAEEEQKKDDGKNY